MAAAATLLYHVNRFCNPTEEPTMTQPADKPLTGIRVLDLARLLPGPVATMHLADMGADVVKIEDPGAGDYARSVGHVKSDVSGFFAAVNRGKRFMRLNLKNADQRDAFLRMAGRADVVVESVRPGGMDKLGIGRKTLKQRNQTLVMCATSGFTPALHAIAAATGQGLA